MCRSKANGGQRCAAHTRAAYERAQTTGNPDRIHRAAIDYASTNEGRETFIAAMHQHVRDGNFEAAAATTTIVSAGDQTRAVNAEVRDLLTEPPSLAVDLDGTVAMGYNEAIHAELIRMGEIPADTPCDPQTYDLTTAFSITPEVAATAIHNVSGRGTTYREASPDLEGVAEINALYDKGATIKIVTARSVEHGGAATMEWLSNTGLKFHEVHYTHDKSTVQYDLLVDDAPYNVQNLTSRDRAATLIDRSWNRDVTLPRISTWSELAPALFAAAGNRNR